jgi:hypothetical protein
LVLVLENSLAESRYSAVGKKDQGSEIRERIRDKGWRDENEE